jgi:hypothetical protein
MTTCRIFVRTFAAEIKFCRFEEKTCAGRQLSTFNCPNGGQPRQPAEDYPP